MKSQLEKTGTLGRKLNVEIPAEIVSSTINKIYKDVQKKASIKGFRPGKVPLATVKSMYGYEVTKDAVQELIQTYYVKALEEHSLDPVSYPEFDFSPLQEDQSFSFVASFELRPEVVLNKYEGLDLEIEKIEISDSQIEKVMNNICASHSIKNPISEDRPTQMGDVVLLDFEGFLNGETFPGGQANDYELELGSHSFIEGFEEGLVGLSLGVEKTLNLKFPDPYTNQELAGKPVDFKVKINKILKKEIPQMSDDFLLSIGAKASVESLKEIIRKDLEQQKKVNVEKNFKEKLFKKLVDLNPIEVPTQLLKEQRELLLEDTKKRLKGHGMNDESIEQYFQKWDEDLSRTAKEMVQSGFIVDAIAEKHKLYWNEEDFESKIVEYSQQTGLEIEKIRNFYQSKEQIQRITYTITEEKVVAFLKSSAHLKEVNPIESEV